MDGMLLTLILLGLFGGALWVVHLFLKAYASGATFGEKGARDAGSAALELQSMLEPGKKHMLEVQRKDESKEHADDADAEGAPPDSV